MVRAKLIIFSFFLSSFSWSQVMEFDMLEMKYDQGHYRMVYRKANKLLDNPEYDFSFLPRYYKALSSLQLAQNDRWFKRNKTAVSDAKNTFLEMNKTFEGRAVLEAHIYELSALKKDLKQWAADLNLSGDKDKFKLVNDLINTVFDDVPYVHDLPKDQEVEIEIPDPTKEKTKINLTDSRLKVIEKSKEFIGVPYKWAGTSPDGFDCSGFTAYVIKSELGKPLARRAEDQYKEVKKVKQKNVQPGDFVFFDSGSGISHVGIIISTENNMLQMIHSSTSIGISIVDINQSAYWSKRIAGFGTYFE